MGSHSYAPWSSCNQKPCLQFLCNISMVLSSNKSMEPSPRRKKWLLLEQGLQIVQFLKDLLQVEKQDFQMLKPESHTGARRRHCFSGRLAQSFSVSLLYTKRTVSMHHWYNWACDTTHEGSARDSYVSLSLPDRCPSAVTFLVQGGPDSVFCESIWRMWCIIIY